VIQNELNATRHSTLDTLILSKKVLSQMRLMDSVIKEAMRLYPVAPFVVRRLPTNVTIADNHHNKDHKPHEPTITLPAHTVACIWIYSMHRHPQYWHNPNAFVPHRWMRESMEEDAGMTNGAYMPFAAGPRNCVGQPLAHVILRSLLAHLLYHYRFRDERLQPNVDPDSLRKDMQAGFTVLPVGGVELLIESRRR
jgi:cytochrome P450